MPVGIGFFLCTQVLVGESRSPTEVDCANGWLKRGCHGKVGPKEAIPNTTTSGTRT